MQLFVYFRHFLLKLFPLERTFVVNTRKNRLHKAYQNAQKMYIYITSLPWNCLFVLFVCVCVRLMALRMCVCEVQFMNKSPQQTTKNAQKSTHTKNYLHHRKNGSASWSGRQRWLVYCAQHSIAGCVWIKLNEFSIWCYSYICVLFIRTLNMK